MRKILIVEDTISEFKYFNTLFEHDDLVVCQNTINSIYDVNSQCFIKDVDFDLVFIHNSFSQQGVSVEIIAKLKEFVNSEFPYRLITYSGGNNLSDFSSDNQYLLYVSRHRLNQSISQFVNFSKKVQKWYLPALYYDNYQMRFLKASSFSLKKKFDISLASICLEVLGYSNFIITADNQNTVLQTIIAKANE